MNAASHILSIIGMCFCLIMYIRINIIAENRKKIMDAIYRYAMDQLHNNNFDSLYFYNQIESFERTMWRLWDYSYKNIVPKEIYSKIEPYIVK